MRENGREQLDSMGLPEKLYSTGATWRAGGGELWLASFRAGTKPDVSTGEASADSLWSTFDENNSNLAAAYFPFSEGWLAGTVYNPDNGEDFDEFIASPGLTLGVTPSDNFRQNYFGTGHHLVTLPGVTDARRQGLLFAAGAKNEGNFGMSDSTADGEGFCLTGHDNAAGGALGEVDPVSFVFIPLNTPNVTMARIHGWGYGQNHEPVAMISSGGNFTVTNPEVGKYRLTIEGQSPSTGVLLLNPSGTNDGDHGYVSDNLRTYGPDGDGWIIFDQDLPTLDGTGQTFGDRAESSFSFAFLPFNAPPTAPGAIPAVETLTNFSKKRTIGWNADVTAITNNNSHGDMYVDVPEATSDVLIQPLGENKGDNAFAVDGAYLAGGDGVLFVTVSEGLRDNTAVGGTFDYGVAGADTDYDGEWWVRTQNADPVFNAEHNINFSAAFFGADTGFHMAQGVATDATTAMLDVAISGVDSLTDGVLIVNSFGNDDNYPTATPRADGSGWDVTVFDNGTAIEPGDKVNHIFLPFDADNLIAARVNDNGSLAASTDPSDFSLTREGTGSYLLTIPGKTPEDGMLLLTSTGEGDSVDNTLVYEPAGNSFRILGLDMITVEEGNILGAYVDVEDTSFMFAYVDFETPPELSGGLAGDLDGDGDVDVADLLEWQRSDGSAAGLTAWQDGFGTGGSTLASGLATVPEPSTCLLVVLTGLLVTFHRNGHPLRKR